MSRSRPHARHAKSGVCRCWAGIWSDWHVSMGFNRDVVFSRPWYPTAESCVEYVDMLLSTECPNCGGAREWAYVTGVYWQCLER